MRKRTAAKKTVRWSLLATALVLVIGLGWLFWEDARDGRDARETDRVQDAQEQTQEAVPPASGPVVPDAPR